MAGGENGCGRTIRSILCCLFFTTGIIIIISAIILVTARPPKLTLLALQLPVSNTNTSTALSFKLKVFNPNLNLGIRFTDLITSFHYPANQSSAFANVIVTEYHQRRRKTVVLVGGSNTANAVNLNEVGVERLVRVRVNGRVKYISWISRSSWRRLRVEGVAGVDTQGYYASENGVRLKSSATMIRLPAIGLYLLSLLLIYSW